MVSPSGTILITGGTGKVGGSLAQICQASSIPYLVASRASSSATASTVHPTVKFDWLDQNTWSNPFITATKSAPIAAVFLVAPPVFESSPILNDFIDFARGAHGVRRFVLLGGTPVEAGGPAYGGTFKYLQELGAKGEVEYGVLRPTWFMDNFAEGYNALTPIREKGHVYSATGDGKIPWISKTDIAAVGFHALTAEEPPNRDYMILGPELLSYDDCAKILSEVTGKKIVHVNIPVEQLAEHDMKTLGLPEEFAKTLAGMDVSIIKEGKEARLNDVVLSVTGKKPKAFREFAEENKNAWL